MIHPTLSRRHTLTLVAKNENDTLLHSSTGMSAFFYEWKQYENHIINLLEPNSFATLTKWLETGDVAMVCAFAGVGAQLRTKFSKGESLWTHYKVPFLSFWFDHPSYNYHQHKVKSPYILNCYHVKDHYTVWKQFFDGFNEGTLLQPLFSRNPYADKINWHERETKILYIKSGINPQSYNAAWSEQPPLIKDILYFLSEKAQKDRNINLAQETLSTFKTASIPTHDKDLFWGVVQEVDGYIRAWRSDKLARALLQQDAVIVGNGWDYLKTETSKDIFTDPIHPSKILEEMVKFKITANSSPLWKYGIHERIGRGIASKCITLTDRTIAGDEGFGDLANYKGFEWSDNLEDICSETIANAQNDPPNLQAGYNRIKSKFAHNHQTFLNPLKAALKELFRKQEDS